MSNYKQQIAATKAGIRKLGDVTLAQASLAVQREVMMNTPVKTGRARSNWFMNIESSSDKITDDTTGKNAVEGATTSESIKGGDTVHITNNLPYIERLNDGHSQQSPAGFVAAATLVARKKVDEIASKGLPKP